jgi:hypothetical protein
MALIDDSVTALFPQVMEKFHKWSVLLDGVDFCLPKYRRLSERFGVFLLCLCCRALYWK